MHFNLLSITLVLTLTNFVVAAPASQTKYSCGPGMTLEVRKCCIPDPPSPVYITHESCGPSEVACEAFCCYTPRPRRGKPAQPLCFYIDVER
ncbi:hypothetical protein BKA70DRAFT_1331972 [Coprinopsis sp. MPI-PUGE-AT-0042]|nr:hypothetical protein BKA70DRAFT_1331972 [Coprinopsis sp. MPI-PUGE-AT-0042]